jgi:hypothetical protein
MMAGDTIKVRISRAILRPATILLYIFTISWSGVHFACPVPPQSVAAYVSHTKLTESVLVFFTSTNNPQRRTKVRREDVRIFLNMGYMYFH